MITINTDTIARALRLAGACAGRHDPAAAVLIEAGNGILTATSGSGPVVGHVRAKADGSLPDGGITIYTQDARSLGRQLAAHCYTHHTTTLTVGDGCLHVRAHGGPGGPWTTTIPFNTDPHARIDYRPLFDAVPAGTVGTGEPIYITPHTLAVWSTIAVVLDPAMTRWTIPGPDKPIRVEVDDAVVQLVMLIAPGRPTEDVYDLWPVPIGLPEPATTGEQVRRG